MRDEDKIRDVVLFMHEAIVHEPVDPVEYGIPPKWINVNDDEIRGIIRALR